MAPTAEQQIDQVDFSERQNAVLESALQLLVEGGERALTTAGIARAANCSKESLYRWFGDRDGLLAAVVSFQARKVRFPDEAAGGRETVRERLVLFGTDLLTVLAGDASLALNRLAIGQANRDDARLGRLLLEHGRGRIERRAHAVLETGRRRGHLIYSDVEAAYRTLYGLIIGDTHTRMLLGAEPRPSERDFAALAEVAVDHFFRLFGAGSATREAGAAPDPD